MASRLCNPMNLSAAVMVSPTVRMPPTPVDAVVLPSSSPVPFNTQMANVSPNRQSVALRQFILCRFTQSPGESPPATCTRSRGSRTPSPPRPGHPPLRQSQVLRVVLDRLGKVPQRHIRVPEVPIRRPPLAVLPGTKIRASVQNICSWPTLSTKCRSTARRVRWGGTIDERRGAG